MSAKYVLFDLDGTLTDPATGITNAIMFALGAMGAEVPPRESLYRFIGPPLSEAFAEFFPKERIGEAIDTYRVYFRAQGMFENAVYTGIPELLRELKNRGIPTAVATSKPEGFAVTILEHFGLAEYFTVIGGADMEGLRGEKPQVIAYVLDRLGLSPENADSCIMVGDRKFDMEGAAAFGMTSIGVTWGYGSRDELLSSGAQMTADTPHELLDLILKQIQ
ncbi:MAG: HAD family hydrolase [Ruminococcaceae bacterium]|nr:HAD family hydrolase [Oscillospiraceae bacterium]